MLLADTGQLGPAADELATAASLLPGQWKTWYNLGRVLRQKGDLGGAWKALTEAARIAPLEGTAQAELASLKELIASKAHQPSALVSLGPATDTAEEHAGFAARLTARNDSLGAAGELLRVLALEPTRNFARLLGCCQIIQTRALPSAMRERVRPRFHSH